MMNGCSQERALAAALTPDNLREYRCPRRRRRLLTDLAFPICDWPYSVSTLHRVMSLRERKKDISPQIVPLIVRSHQIFRYTSQTIHIEHVKC